MRKKIILLLSVLLLCGCNEVSSSIDSVNSSNDSSTALSSSADFSLPVKTASNDNSARTSPINSQNLDQYLFRSDIQYVDLRNIDMVVEEGYVCGFEFIPFYQIICSFTSTTTLYSMSRKTIDEEIISAGQIGSFTANYVESLEQIESLFSKEKPIFLISQGGSESSYMINLLIQLGYDESKLYNVGGVSNNEGISAYRDVKTNKYYVSAGVSGIEVSVDFTFTETLTPIK